jgi:integrase
MFRHTRATKWIKDEHLSLPTTSRVLGHKSVETTNNIYLAYTDKDLRAAMGKSGEKRRSYGE